MLIGISGTCKLNGRWAGAYPNIQGSTLPFTDCPM
jgi:hypothetical protein